MAGKGKPVKELYSVKTQLQQLGFEVTEYQTLQMCDYQGIAQALQSKSDFFAIVVMGGDGTLNDVVNSVPEKFETPLLILPCGSGNDFATFLHGKAPQKEILTKLTNPKLHKMDCGKCNNKLFINGLGIGFDGWVAGEANAGPQFIPASLKYHLAILRGLFSFRSFYTNLGQSLILAIANGATYGGGFKIAPVADAVDGKLDLWIIKPIKWFKRPYYLDKIKKGKHAGAQGPYQWTLIETLSIISHKTLPAHLDGEYFESDTFEISILKHHLSLIS